MAKGTRRSPSQYNFAKLEFDETLLDKHFSPLTSRRIDYVVVHHMTVVGKDDAVNALDACYSIWQTRQASAHYGVQGTRIRQYVYDKDFAWATGSNAGNLHGISIEHTNTTAGPKWLVSNQTMLTGAKLAAWIHVVYGLGRPTTDANGKSGTLRQHEAFTSTSCPGPFLGGTEWMAYYREVVKQYDIIKKGKPVEDAPVVPPKQETPLPPIPAGPTLTKKTSYANLSGYDTVGKGQATRVARADECARLLLSGDPDFIHAVEADESMLPKMDKVLADYTRVPQGGAGRESWYKSGQGLKILAAKRYDVKGTSELNGDDKPYLIYVWEQDGFRGIEVVFHSENETKGTKQKPQLRDVLDQAEAWKVKYDVRWSNVCVTGDTNSESALTWAQDWGWEAADRKAPAASRVNEEYKSLNRWSSKTVLGNKIDLFIVRPQAVVTRYNQTVGSKSSSIIDHNKQFLVRELLK